MHHLEDDKFIQWLEENRFHQLPDGTWTRARCNGGLWTNTTECMYEMYLGYLKYGKDDNNI